MQAASRVLLVPFALALPFTATAETEPLVVEYSGRILEVSEAPAEYVVGNSISGRLLIDRSVAYGDSNPTPSSALFRSGSQDFVSGFWTGRGDAFDQVSINDDVLIPGISRPVDTLSIEDWFVVEGGSLDGARRFGLHATLHDFLDNASLDLSFDLTAADVDEPHESLLGRITFSNFGPIPFVSFALDRLTVKPKSCLAPR